MKKLTHEPLTVDQQSIEIVAMLTALMKSMAGDRVREENEVYSKQP